MDDSTRKNKPGTPLAIRIVIFTLISVIAIFVCAYGIVYLKIYGFIQEIAKEHYWLKRDLIVMISGTIAVAAAIPIIRAYAHVAMANGGKLDNSIVAATVVVTLIWAYHTRNKYFSPGNDPMFICAPVHPDDTASIENLGEGEAEGRRCVKLTPENAAVARSIDKKKIPKQIIVRDSKQLYEMQWFREGVAAIYYGGIVDASGLPKLYDGPGFDPDTPEFLAPVTVPILEDLKLRHKTKESLEAKQKAAIELAAAASAAAAAREAERQRLEKQRVEENQQRVAQAKEEAERQRQRQIEEAESRRQRDIQIRQQREVEQRQRQRAEAIADVEASAQRIDLSQSGAFTIPNGYWVAQHGSQISFYLNGQYVERPSQDLFRRYDGQVVAQPPPPVYIFGNSRSQWIVVKKFLIE